MRPPVSAEATLPGLGLSTSDPIACVELPALRLQLLLRERPDWASLPVVVIDEDRPQGLVLEANTAARQAGIHPGIRYAHALGLCRDLRAGVIPPASLGASLAHLTSRLRAFSPHIELSDDEPGVFWLDASGLTSLFDALSAWSHQLVDTLKIERFTALAAIAFSRFGAYAAVKSLLVDGRAQIRVLTDPSAELRLASTVPLTHLGLPASTRERLERLNLTTLGDLLALPTASLMKRWGPDVVRLCRLARGEVFSPLRPSPDRPPLERTARLDYLEYDAHRILTRLDALLAELLADLPPDTLIAELTLSLGVEGAAVRERTTHSRHRFRPASPTLDHALLLDLIRLRLEHLDLTRGVVELGLTAAILPANAVQLGLFPHNPHRDRDAAGRALARISAELGEASVVRVTLRDAHLPRTRTALSPFDPRTLPAPNPSPPHSPPPLIRRIFPRSEPLPARPRDLRNDGWVTRDPAQGPIIALHGPFTIAGGWWLALASPTTSPEIHREYAFAETRRGDLLWIYHDRRRRRHFEEGRIE